MPTQQINIAVEHISRKPLMVNPEYTIHDKGKKHILDINQFGGQGAENSFSSV